MLEITVEFFCFWVFVVDIVQKSGVTALILNKGNIKQRTELNPGLKYTR